ncbi:MAG: preprotein translocase subunit SecG [Victivallales bacterium]|nr:preprotein translocase subunit SecG [Victivallales bacterium]
MIEALKVVLYILSIGSALLLIGVIMLQQSKSGGGMGAISGGVAETTFGTEATNVLTKVTTWLAVVFLVSTLLLGTVIGRLDKDQTSVVEKLAAQQQQQQKIDAPAETKPAETKPAEAETKPAEAKPAETKPAETKPAEAKPAEAETKPAENKPAEPAK